MSNTIHLTDTRTWRDCRRKYRYSIVDRIAKITDGSANPFSFGTAGHHLMHQLYTGQDLDFSVAPDEDSKYLLEFLLNMYKADVHEQDMQKGWQVLASEQVMRVEVAEFAILFTMDLMVLVNGSYWIMDHKFLSRFPDPRNLEIDDQITGYLWATHKIGYKPRGLWYNVLLKKELEPPRILQNGTVSKAATMLDNTTLTQYKEALKACGLSEDGYREQLEYLEKRDHPIFRRYTCTRNAKELAYYEECLVATLREIDAPTTVWFPNPHYDCYRCDFHDLCKAETEGADWRSYIGATHRLKEVDER